VLTFGASAAILAAAVAYTIWDERRQARKRREYEAREARHDPPRNHAWPPHGQMPKTGPPPSTPIPPPPPPARRPGDDFDLWRQEMSDQ
jgi:hypothetical protein